MGGYDQHGLEYHNQLECHAHRRLNPNHQFHSRQYLHHYCEPLGQPG